MSRILLPGTRVHLRDWKIADLSAYERWQKPGQAWQELDGPYYKTDQDLSSELTAALREQIENRDFSNPRSRLVIADAKTDELIGVVSSYWESRETNWLCIGIIIYDPDHWKRGYGSESMRLWMNYLFAEYPEIVRLDMRTWSGNLGLISLARKLGFTQEACFRKARIVKGAYYDGLGFGILRGEWSAH